MGFWKNIIGNESKEKHPRPVDLSESEVTDVIDESLAVDVPKNLREVLIVIRPSGLSEFVADRDAAKEWYASQNFTVREYDEIGTKVYEEMAIKADEQSIWEEAWALYHHTLCGYAKLGELAVMPALVWRLGRSHMGLRNQPLSYLYLDSAYLLFENEQETALAARALAEKVVMAVLIADQSTYQETLERLYKMLSSNNDGIELNREIALTLFSEGEKNKNWLDEEDKPIPLSLDLARSYYEVSLELSRKRGDTEAVGHTLLWLGDTWYKLKQNNKAESNWSESLSVFTKLNDDNLQSVVTERLGML